MKTVMTILVSASLLAGCATMQKGETGGFMQRYAKSKRLAQAVEMLSRGNSNQAARELRAISEETPVPGVTDEALFRLALLSLKPGTDKSLAQGEHLLKRLRKDYPRSPWTAQAAPLIDLMEHSDELRSQNRNLKAVNQSLTKEINELNKNIEQLKHLDVELEQLSLIHI